MNLTRLWLAWVLTALSLAALVWLMSRATPPRRTDTPGARARLPGRSPGGDAVADRSVASPFEAIGYRAVHPGYDYRFPRDLAAHPDFRTEWWYYTGHLASGNRQFGFELTFFRVGLDPRRARDRSAWALHTVYFAHLAVTDQRDGKFRVAEKAARPALGMAGATPDRYRVWIDDWSAGLADGVHRLRATAADLGVDLELTPVKPPVIHGQAGVSRKSSRSPHTSHYFSIPRLAARGRIRSGDEWVTVAGIAWLDREFFTSGLPSHVAGWDWLALQLDDGRDLMLYLLRQADGGLEPASGGTLVEADGRHRALSAEDLAVEATGRWHSPRSGADYPSGWRVCAPGVGIDLTLTPTLADQELHLTGLIPVTYWEGSVRVAGTGSGLPISGRGYVELTGYAGRPIGF